MNLLDKLRKQPIYIRKIILWITIIILGIILGYLWIYSSYKNIENFKKQNIMENIELPELELPLLEALKIPTPIK